MAQQAFLGRFTLPSNARKFTVDPTPPGGGTALTLDVADRYIKGYAAESAFQFIEHFEEKLQTVDPMATATIDLDGADAGKCKLTFSVDTDVTWTDAALRDLLGFNADLSGTFSYTSDHPVRYLWLPALMMSEHPVDLAEFWQIRSGTTGHLGPDGASHTRAGGAQFLAKIGYDLLELAEVIIPANAGRPANKTLERFFIDVFHAGMPVRILPDRSSYTSTTYKTGLFSAPEADAPIGELRDWIDPSLGEGNHALWNVDLFFLKYTGAGA